MSTNWALVHTYFVQKYVKYFKMQIQVYSMFVNNYFRYNKDETHKFSKKSIEDVIHQYKTLIDGYNHNIIFQ